MDAYARLPAWLTATVQQRLQVLYLALLYATALVGGSLLSQPPVPVARLLLIALLAVSLLSLVALVLMGGWTLLALHSVRSALAPHLAWLGASGPCFLFAFGALLEGGREQQLIAQLGIADNGGSSAWTFLAIIAFTAGSICAALGVIEGVHTLRRVLQGSSVS